MFAEGYGFSLQGGALLYWRGSGSILPWHGDLDINVPVEDKQAFESAVSKTPLKVHENRADWFDVYE